MPSESPERGAGGKLEYKWDFCVQRSAAARHSTHDARLQDAHFNHQKTRHLFQTRGQRDRSHLHVCSWNTGRFSQTYLIKTWELHAMNESTADAQQWVSARKTAHEFLTWLQGFSSHWATRCWDVKPGSKLCGGVEVETVCAQLAINVSLNTSWILCSCVSEPTVCPSFKKIRLKLD